MPLHPVPIIIGGTLALIGSGIAFKKFVYDPHLAPLLEAYLAQLVHHHRDTYEPVAVPVASAGRSTARADHHPTTLRRRSRPSVSSQEEYELRQPLLNDYAVRVPREQDSWDRVPAREPRVRKDSHALVDTSAVDQEVRRVIFDYHTPRPLSPAKPPPIPASLTPPPMASLAGLQMAPDIHAPPDQTPVTLQLPGQPEGHVPASTTFSFLSLSQASSPEVPFIGLPSLSQTLVPADLHSAREEDVISLPETMSSYVDAESYSPSISRAASPSRLPREVMRGGEVGPEAVGMSYVGANVPSPHRLSSSTRRPISRGPRSVVSLSDGEESGWRSETSEWEAL